MLRIATCVFLLISSSAPAALSAKKPFFFIPHYQLDSIYQTWPPGSQQMLMKAVELIQSVPMKKAKVRLATKIDPTTPKDSALLYLILTARGSEQLRNLEEVGESQILIESIQAFRIWDEENKAPRFRILILWDSFLKEAVSTERYEPLEDRQMALTVALAEHVYGLFPGTFEKGVSETSKDGDEKQIRTQIVSIDWAVRFMKALEAHPRGRTLSEGEKAALKDLLADHDAQLHFWAKLAKDKGVCRDLFPLATSKHRLD